MQLQHASLRITEYSLHRRAGPKTWEAIGIPQSSLFSHPQIMPDFFILETVYSPWCSACFSLIFTHSIRRRPEKRDLSYGTPEHIDKELKQAITRILEKLNTDFRKARKYGKSSG